jgi:glutamate transport system substrate-binding protein
MMMRKMLALVAVGSAAALVLTGCSGPSQGSGSGPSAGSCEVAKNVNLTGSPTYDRIKAAGKVRVGVKEDQPGLGYLDSTTGQRTGFDVEIAQCIAAKLGIEKDKIEFKAIPSANREAALTNGDVDFYAGTYSITDARKKLVDFAGPYFETGQGLLVKKNDQTISSEKDLAGKTICSVTGSTPIQKIKADYPSTKTVEFETYSQCVEALNDGSADAVTTDQAILIGYAAQAPDNLKVVGQPFTKEKYGIGLKKGDDALRHFINKFFANDSAAWKKIYDDTLGKSGSVVEQPKPDDY